MKIAMPVWEGGISPVFDVARQLLVVEIEGREVRKRSKVALREEIPRDRVSRLVELGVEVLICGGISRSLADFSRSCGVELIPWIKGAPDQILAAYLSGNLDAPRFAMPGARADVEAT